MANGAHHDTFHSLTPIDMPHKEYATRSMLSFFSKMFSFPTTYSYSGIVHTANVQFHLGKDDGLEMNMPLPKFLSLPPTEPDASSQLRCFKNNLRATPETNLWRHGLPRAHQM